MASSIIAPLDAEALHRALDAASAGDVRSAPVEAARKLIDEHHNFLIPRLAGIESLMTRVAVAYGLQHCQLLQLVRAFVQLKNELQTHVADEDAQLVPMLQPGGDADQQACELRDARANRQRIGELLNRMRDLSHGYAPPADACGTYCSLLTRLADFDLKLRRHLSEESRVLQSR